MFLQFVYAQTYMKIKYNRQKHCFCNSNDSAIIKKTHKDVCFTQVSIYFICSVFGIIAMLKNEALANQMP